MKCILPVFLLIPLALHADPLIPPRGIVNGASFVPAALPGGAIAQGGIFSVFGSGLGPATPVQASSFPLGNNLGGVSVKVFQGTTSINAYPIFVAANQINVVMPSNAPLGKVSVQVTYNGVASNPAPISVVNNSFGIFSANSAGNGPGIVYNFNSQASQPVNALTVAAMPGQVETLWGTGLGPLTTPDNVAPPAGSLATKVEVFVAGLPAVVSYSGRSPCCSGVDQIVFTVPANAPLGCYVPVMVRTNGATVSNAITMAITQDGSPCLGTLSPVSKAFATGGKVGFGTLFSWTVHSDLETDATDFGADLVQVSYRNEANNPFVYQPLISLPPAGSCTTYFAAANLTDYTQPNPLLTLPGTVLDGGTMGNITGPGGSVPLGITPGVNAIGNVLGFNLPLVQASLFLSSGNYTVTTAGGADIGAASIVASTVPRATWTNRDSLVTVNRANPMTLNWSGTDATTQVLIFGGNVDIPTNSTALFVCAAAPGAGTFTVPGPVLQSLPPGRLQYNQQNGFVFLSTTPASGPTPFTAQGLDVGGMYTISSTGRTVMFQ